MTADNNKALMERLYQAVTEGDLALLEESLADDFVDHDVPPGYEPSREGVMQWFADLREAVPDVQMAAEDMVSEGDKVCVRVRMQGTQQGELLGIPGTGKRFDIQGFDMLRVVDGKLVEHWAVFDMPTMLQQVGVADVPGAG